MGFASPPPLFSKPTAPNSVISIFDVRNVSLNSGFGCDTKTKNVSLGF